MYWLFIGYNYYPEAFLGDYVGAFPTEEAALEYMTNSTKDGGQDDNKDWWSIVTVNEYNDLVEVSNGTR